MYWFHCNWVFKCLPEAPWAIKQPSPDCLALNQWRMHTGELRAWHHAGRCPPPLHTAHYSQTKTSYKRSSLSSVCVKRNETVGCFLGVCVNERRHTPAGKLTSHNSTEGGLFPNLNWMRNDFGKIYRIIIQISISNA